MIAPSDDPDYERWFSERAQALGQYNEMAALLGPAVTVVVILLLMRAVFVRAIRVPGARRPCGAGVADGGGGPGVEGGGGGPDLRLAEGVWTCVGATVLLAWSWVVMLKSNGGCVPELDTSACLAGWPLVRMAPQARRYYSAELGWYLHLLLKCRLGIGLPDGLPMQAHHVATIYLILASYAFSLGRAGVVLLALLNASTPLLHLSKTAHHVGYRRFALVSFALFAAVFLATRVVAFPVVFLPLGLVVSRRHIPRLLETYPVVFGIMNGLLITLVALQWWWFASVLRVMRQATAGDAARLDAATRELERKEEDGGCARKGDCSLGKGGFMLATSGK